VGREGFLFWRLCRGEKRRALRPPETLQIKRSRIAEKKMRCDSPGVAGSETGRRDAFIVSISSRERSNREESKGGRKDLSFLGSVMGARGGVLVGT